MARREIIFHPKFEPLFRPPSPDDPRYTILTSGRAGGKSTAVSTSTVRNTYYDDKAILYSRYTMAAAEISVIPEFTEKIKLLCKERHFQVSKDIITNRVSNGVLYFRGILTSSGNQTAKLKSIPNLREFFLDEAQELVNPVDFDTIDLSIRDVDAVNSVKMALNPSDIHHWIYKRFFKKPGVPYDFNGVVDNVRYIHTDWRDMRAYLSPSFIEIARRCERENPEKYQNIYLGDWAVKRSGLIYPRWEKVTLADIPPGLDWWYGNDWGYSNDPDALVRMAFDPLTRTLYVIEVIYKTGMLPKDVAAAIRRDCEAWGTTADRVLVYCDPARPDSIAELRVQYGINAVPGINRDKVGRIGYLQGFKVRYVGENVQDEVETYSWTPSREDPEVFTDIPQDGGDHCFAGATLIATTNGDKRIDELKENDLVLTSEGYRRVLKVFDNGYKKIRKYSIIFPTFVVELEATPDHKVKTTKGWKQFQELCATDELFPSRSSTERSTTSTPGSVTSVDTTSGSTASSGSSTTDQYRKATTSITRTQTRTTTTSATSSSSSEGSTSQSTRTNGSQKIRSRSAETCTRPWRRPKSGTAQMKAGSGIASTLSPRSRGSASNTPATSAARSSSSKRPTSATTSAPKSARQLSGGAPARTTSPIFANNAGRSSGATNSSLTASARPLVPVQVVEVLANDERVEHVFDISVEGMHEYFANGVLVHNCMDASSYATTHLRRLAIANDDGDLPGGR